MEYINLQHIGHFFSTTIKLFALMTPPAVLSAFLSSTKRYDAARKRRTALRTSLAAFIIGLFLYVLGQELFDIFGITLDAFRIGTGILLFLTAVSLMNDQPSQDHAPSADEDVSVVPLAIPMCMGPATIGTIMVWGATAESHAETLSGILSLAVASFLIYLMLLTADRVGKMLGRTGLAVLAKLTGLLLAAIAAQVVFTGIQAFLK